MAQSGNRGGGQEEFDSTAEALRKRRQQREQMAAQEEAYRRKVEASSAADSQAAVDAEILARSRREAADVGKRAAQVGDIEVSSVKSSTRAIEENAAARRRANAEAQRAQELARRNVPDRVLGRALQDPAFSDAYKLADDGNVTQYRIRKELEGVGSRRATVLQSAIQAGARPSDIGREDAAERIRLRNAVLDEERAEAALAQATKELTSVRRRASATDADRTAARETRDAAKLNRDAAIASRESVETENAARAENRAAMAREAAAREELAARELAEARNRPIRGLLPASTPDRPLSEAQTRTLRDRPYVVRDTQGAGQLSTAGQQFGYDEKKAAANATAQARIDAEHASRTAAVTQIEDRLANSELRTSRAVQLAAVEYGTYSDALRRHGALTTEFINAAARGQTTLRELGNQSIATAGKFAGWTAAGAALYTAVDAVRALGRGAIDAHDGVEQLKRVLPASEVDSNDVTGDLSGLAGQFNVPISTASDAVYRMAQRFKSVPEAVATAKAALYSFKTGEVDVATSTENLIAITNGFGLSSQRVGEVFDQINQAQNTFGIRISDTEAGLAKAAGTYRSAGGDLNYLLALFVAISRATNRSGQEIGTGLARGVQEIRKPDHIDTLRGLGVDVDPDNFQSTLKSALSVAQNNPALSNKLAAGLLGNQYARLLVPVLNNQKTLNQAIGDTSPERSKGSASRELQRVLSQYDEQLHKVGVSLERLGIELEQSGALLPFGLALKTLNGVLSVATELTNVFNGLPSGLRESLTILGEIGVTMAVLRRIGVTDRLAGGPLGFLTNPDKRLKAVALNSTSEVETALQAELRNVTSQRLKAAIKSDVGQTNVSRFIAAPEYQATRALPDAHPERIAQDEELLSIQKQANDLANREFELEKQQLATYRQTELIRQQRIDLEAASAAEVRALVEKNSIPVKRSLETESNAGAAYLYAGGAVAIDSTLRTNAVAEAAKHAAEGPLEPSILGIAPNAAVEASTSLKESIQEKLKAANEGISDDISSATEQAVADSTEIFRAKTPQPKGELIDKLASANDLTGRGADYKQATERFFQQSGATASALKSELAEYANNSRLGGALKKLPSFVGEAGKSGEALANAAKVGQAAVIRGAGHLGRAADALAPVGASLKSFATDGIRPFLSSLGFLDAGLLALVVVPELLNHAKESAAKLKERTEGFEKTNTSLSAQRKQNEDAQKFINTGAGTQGEGFGHAVSNVIDTAGDVLSGKVTPGSLLSGSYESRFQRDQDAREAAKETLEEQRRIADLQARDRRLHPNVVSSQFTDTILGHANQNFKDARDGLLTLGEVNKQLDDRLTELSVQGTRTDNKTHAASVARINQLKRQVATALGPKTDFNARFNGATVDELSSDLDTTIANIAHVSGRGRAFNFTELTEEYTRLYKQLKDSSDPKAIQQLAQAQEKYLTAFENEAQQQITAAQSGNTEQARRAGFRAAGQTLSHETDAAHRNLVAAQAAQNDQKDQLATAQSRLQGLHVLDANTAPGAVVIPGQLLPANPKGELQDAIHKQEAAIKQIQARIDSGGATVKKAQDELNEAEARQKLAQQALKDTSYQDRQQGRQINVGLENSKTADPITQAVNNIHAARRQLDDAKNTYGVKSRQYKQALTDLNTARLSQAQAILQNVEADNAVLLAEAGNDPIAQAQAQVQATLNVIRAQAAHPNRFSRADKQYAKANYIQAQNAQQQTLRDNAQQVAQLNQQITEAQNFGDPVAAARAAQQAAAVGRGNARTQVERLQATLDTINANNQLQDALTQEQDARFDLLSSQTEDPLKQARIAQRQAAYDLEHAHPGIDTINKQAAYNRSIDATRSAKIQDKEDTINFELEMGKITTDAAAEQIAALAKTHGISKKARRDLLLQAKQLRDGAAGQYDLNTDLVRLPTLTEVRRFVAGGRAEAQAARRSTTNNNRVTINVRRDSHLREVVKAFEDITGQHVQSSARARRQR